MKALSYLGSKRMHKCTHACRSGHFILNASGSKTRQSKVSVNSVCVGKSEIPLCSLVGGLSLLNDSDDSDISLHHHVSSFVKENAFIFVPGKSTTIPDQENRHFSRCCTDLLKAVQLFVGAVSLVTAPSSTCVEQSRKDIVQNKAEKTLTKKSTHQACFQKPPMASSEGS